MARSDDQSSLRVRPILGGLQTKLQPSAMASSQSPDLKNVLFNQRTVRRREGCAPVNRFAARKNSIRNRGYQWTASSLDGTTNHLWKRVNGMMVAGHREALNAYDRVPDSAAPTLHVTRLTASLMVQPDPGGAYGYETAGRSKVNWFDFNSFSTADKPHSVKCRPILSKGPVQTMYHTVAANPVPTLKSAWNAGEQMPFSMMVWNGTQPVFEFISLQPAQSFSAERKIRGRTSGTTAIVLHSAWTLGGVGAIGTVWLRYVNGAGFAAGEDVEDAGTAVLIATVFTAQRNISGPHWRCAFFANATSGVAAGRLIRLDSPIGSEFGPDPLHTYRLTFYANCQDAGASGSSSNRAWFQVSEELQDGSSRTFTVGTPPVGSAWSPTSNVDEVAGALATNQQPVMLFDLPPQACLNYALTADAYLNIDHNADVIGFEGKVEDIQLWASDKSSGGTSFAFGASMARLDRRDSSLLAELMAYWGPDTVSERRTKPEIGMWEKDRAWFPEGTGKDIPLMPAPGVPTWNDANGKGSLWFNGRTSYSFMPVASILRQSAAGTSYNLNVAQDPGALLVPFGTWQDMLWDGAATYRHSISIQFIPDSIEPGSCNDAPESGAYNQVATEMPTQMLMDWPFVVRLGLSNKGHLWVQPPGHAGAPAGGEMDDLEVRDSRVTFGTTAIVPGQRYVLKYVRESSIQAKVYLNGNLEATVAVTAPAGATRKRIGPMVLGAFAGTKDVPYEVRHSDLRWTYNAGGVAKAQFNCTHFVGRIEDVRFGAANLVTGLPLDTSEPDVSLSLLVGETDNSGGTTTRITLREVERAPTLSSGDAIFASLAGDSINATLTEHGARLRRAYAVKAITQQAVAAGPLVTKGFLTLTTILDAIAVDGTQKAPASQVRIFSHLAHWDFADNILGRGTQSRYYDNLEIHPVDLTGADDFQANPHVYREFSVVPDRLGFVFPMELRCHADKGRGTYPITTAGVIKDFNLGLWDQSSPQEERPRLAAGISVASVDEVPITLISQLKKSNGDRFLVTAAANTVYWLRTPWWQGKSPYPPALDSAQSSLFVSGRLRSFVKHYAVEWDMLRETAAGAHDGKSLTVEFWMQAAEFSRGVRRLLAMCWDGSMNALNWRVVQNEDGSITIEGQGWSVGTGPLPGSPSITSNVLADRQWHHVACVLDQRFTLVGPNAVPSFDRIFVDGVSQPLWTSGSRTTSTAGTGFGWIGGSDHGLLDPLVGAPGTQGAFVEPFFGFLRDVRVSRGARYARNFTPSIKPLVADSGSNTDLPANYQAYSTISLYPLDEKADAVARNIAGAQQPAYVRCNELIPLNDGDMLASNSSLAFPWDWKVFRDVLYLSNGLGPPLAVRQDGILVRDGRNYEYLHDTFTAPARMWRGAARSFGFSVGRFGTSPPAADRLTFDGVGAGGALTADVYTVAITHVSLDGYESDPVIVTAYANMPANANVFRVAGIPRPLEPHVARRRIYISGPNSAGALLFTREDATDDLVTYGIETVQVPGAGSIYSPTRGTLLPARFIEFHRQRGYGVGFPTSSNGNNRGQFSEGGEPESFSRSLVANNVLSFDAGDGNPASAIKQFVGRLLVGMRNAMFLVTPGDTSIDFRQDQINATVGPSAGHSVVQHDNRMFFRGEKGVYLFDGASVQYVGDDLEGIWPDMDPTELGQLQSHGIYVPPLNQYWLMVKRVGAQFAREILVLDMGAIDEQTGRPPWTILQTLPISYLEGVDDDATDLHRTLIGTPHGQVYEFLVGQIDGSREVSDPSNAGSLFTISGTLSGGGHTTTTLNLNAIDNLGSGHRGLMVLVTRADKSASAEARISSNTYSQIVLRDPLPFTPANGDTVQIGTYEAYWTSGWTPLDTPSQAKRVRFTQLDFTPQPGVLLDVAMDYAIGAVPVARTFRALSSIPANRKASIDMSTGHHTGNALHLAGQGMYARLRFGTSGVKVPFGVIGFEMFFTSEGAISGPKGT